jgi:hypothetical protein
LELLTQIRGISALHNFTHISINNLTPSRYQGKEQGWENLQVKVHLGDPGFDGRIILRWLFRKWDVGM